MSVNVAKSFCCGLFSFQNQNFCFIDTYELISKQMTKETVKLYIQTPNLFGGGYNSKFPDYFVFVVTHSSKLHKGSKQKSFCSINWKGELSKFYVLLGLNSLKFSS